MNCIAECRMICIFPAEFQEKLPLNPRLTAKLREQFDSSDVIK